MRSLYINCDMAESYGSLTIGDDLAILPYIDAANIACGFHGGDPLTIQNTIKEAIRLKKDIGAHPSYPDLMGFGRRMMDIPLIELSAIIHYQISAVKSMTESMGGRLNHVKAHGALYNKATVDFNTARVFVETVFQMGEDLIVFAPFGSEMARCASDIGLHVKYESFGDRRYGDDGLLLSRTIEGSIINEPMDILAQIRSLTESKTISISGNEITIHSDTICLHGDHPKVLETVQLIHQLLR